MIRIESHIEKLLLSHDCVIVSGIGGFVTRSESAVIASNGTEILPPYRSIGFNSQLNTNDGLLVQSYMTTYDTSFPKAQSLVEENVREIRRILTQEGEYTVGSLGKLQLSQNQSLIFTPANECGIFCKEHYGLDLCPVNAIEPQKEIVSHQSSAIPTNEKSIKTQAEVNAPTISIAAHNPSDMPQQDNSHYVIRISKNAVRNTVATIAAALLYFIFTIAPSTNPINTNLQEATIIGSIQNSNNKVAKTQQKKAKSTSVATKTNTTKKVNTTKETKSKEVKGGVTSKVSKTAEPKAEESVAPTAKSATPTAKSTTPKAKSVAPNTKSTKKTTIVETSAKEVYTIVLASAVSKSGAMALIKDLKSKGFSKAEFMTSGKMNRVVYASYNSQEEAYAAIKQLRSKDKKFESAWVMKK